MPSVCIQFLKHEYHFIQTAVENVFSYEMIFVRLKRFFQFPDDIEYNVHEITHLVKEKELLKKNSSKTIKDAIIL